MTSKNLANTLNVSSKTILSDLNYISDVIEKHGGKILSVPGQGIRLIVHDEDKINDYVNKIEEKDNEFFSLDLETKILYYLLFSRKKSSINVICEELYISPSTLLYYIKKIRDIISVYNLKIENKRNCGFQIVGTEFEKRLYMSQYISDYKSLSETSDILSTYINKRIFNEVDQIVSEILQKEKFNISYINYDSFINYLVVTINEIKIGNGIERLNNSIGSEMISTELTIAGQITEKISKQYQIEISGGEKSFVAVLLLAKKFTPLKNTQESDNDLVEKRNKNEFNDLVIAMLEKIKYSTNMDFTKNQSLISSLNKHMIPLYIRMLYGIKTENTSLKEIKKYCILAYNLAAIGVSVLVENLKVNIDENEIGYIALYLKIALEVEEENKLKKSVLFISDQQVSNMMLYIHELHKQFDKYIKELVCKDVNLVDQDDFDFYDLIINTSELNFNSKKPVIKVKRVVDMDEFKTIENYLTDRVSVKENILKLYNRNLFFLDIKATTKEECIDEICQRIAGVMELPTNFKSFVLYRELFGSTDFGEHIAIPHPYIPMANKSFISATLLKKPVFWGKNKVSVIFLLSLNQYEPPPIKFYDLMSELLSSSRFASDISYERNFDAMIRKISEILDIGR